MLLNSVRRRRESTALLCALAIILFTPEAAMAAGQWTLADGGTTCFNTVADAPVDGPRILATRQPLQEEIGANDAVYIQATPGGLAGGERLEIVRNTGPLEHPTGGVVGQILEVLGTAEVVTVGNDRAILMVTGSCRELEIGDVLRPLRSTELPETPPRMPVFDANILIDSADADGFLVMGALESLIASNGNTGRQWMVPQEMYGQRDLVVIDQGADATWQEEDVALIYRDRVYANSDVFRGALDNPLALGRGIVVRADATSAIVQLTDSVEEIQLGDRARKIGTVWDFVNRPPTIACRAERPEVRFGESVRLMAEVTDPDDDPVTVSWSVSSGALSSEEGATVTYTAAPGESTVAVTAVADDGGDDGRVECGLMLQATPPPSAVGEGRGVAAGDTEVLEFMCPEFPLANSEVDNRCKAVLDEVALRLRQDARASASLVGHSDSVGSDENNQRFSEERAEKAKRYLVETHGIEADRIATSGAGASDPIGDNATEEGRLRNRRVEIRVTIPGG